MSAVRQKGRGFLESLAPLYRLPQFRRLFGLNLLLGVSTAFVMPFMSMFGTLEVKMSLFAFGSFMTVNAVAGIVIATVLAHYSDIRFSRRAMLLVGSVAGVLGYCGYAYFRSFVPLVLVGSLLLGVHSITFSQLFAWARELVSESGADPSRGALYINVFRMFIALAWTVGPAVASFVMIAFSFRGLFLCAAADLALFALVVWRAAPSSRPATALGAGLGSASVWRLLGRGDLLAHFAAFVLIAAATTISMMNLPLLIMKTLRGTEADVGLAYSIAPLFELPFMLYFGWLATVHAPARVIRIGMLVALTYYSCLALVRAPWQIFLCQGMSAAATSVVSGVAITYFQGHLPHHPGTATNLYSNAQRIGSTAGYFLFVGLAWRFGHRAVFEACALFALLAVGLMFVPARGDLRSLAGDLLHPSQGATPSRSSSQRGA